MQGLLSRGDTDDGTGSSRVIQRGRGRRCKATLDWSLETREAASFSLLSAAMLAQFVESAGEGENREREV